VNHSTVDKVAEIVVTLMSGKRCLQMEEEVTEETPLNWSSVRITKQHAFGQLSGVIV
jgi:hypothetical protein